MWNRNPIKITSRLSQISFTPFMNIFIIKILKNIIIIEHGQLKRSKTEN